jgi:hypothetical protein
MCILWVCLSASEMAGKRPWEHLAFQNFLAEHPQTPTLGFAPAAIAFNDTGFTPIRKILDTALHSRCAQFQEQQTLIGNSISTQEPTGISVLVFEPTIWETIDRITMVALWQTVTFFNSWYVNQCDKSWKDQMNDSIVSCVWMWISCV